MNTLNTRIAQEQEEWTQLTRQNKTRIISTNLDLYDVDIRRQVVIGGLVCDYLPDVLHLQLAESEIKNRTEFDPFIRVLSWLKDNQEYVKFLMWGEVPMPPTDDPMVPP